MKTIESAIIDWKNPDVLGQIMLNIKDPLEKIIESSKQSINSGTGNYEVIFSSSKQINDVIENILEEIKSKSVKLTIQERPDFFEIYESNANVQKMCSNCINTERITRNDQNWLLNLEKVTKNNISHSTLSCQ